MRCIICGLSKDASKEHIIPEALGNEKFITIKVCQECNNRLGTNVDNYLTDYIIISQNILARFLVVIIGVEMLLA